MPITDAKKQGISSFTGLNYDCTLPKQRLCLQKSQQIVTPFEVVSDMKYFHLFVKLFQALTPLF